MNNWQIARQPSSWRPNLARTGEPSPGCLVRKAYGNPHFEARIRATIYEHPEEYVFVSRGCYPVA